MMKVIHLFLFLSLSLFAENFSCRDLMLSFDLEQLESELKLVEEFYLPRHIGQTNWLAIPLRNPTGTTEHLGVELTPSIKNKKMVSCKNNEFLDELPYINSVLEEIAALFNTEIGLVRISKVPSRNIIAKHKDGAIFDYAKGEIFRLHIPITSHDLAFFLIEDNVYNLIPGNLYFTNVSKTHSVTNNSPIDRVHLIIDVQANETLRRHIKASPEASIRNH